MLNWLRNLGKAKDESKETQRQEGLDLRGRLRGLAAGTHHPSQVFPQVASQKASWFMITRMGEEKPALALAVNNQRYGVIFSTEVTAAPFIKEAEHRVLEVQGYSLLQSYLRLGFRGLLIDPGSDQVVLDHDHVRLLFREYALVKGAGSRGAWVPAQDHSLLAVELGHSVYTVPVFLSEEDATGVCRQHGGNATFVPWQQVRARCREVGADAAFFGYSMPEQIGISRRQLSELCADGSLDPLDRLEDEVQQSLGIANAAAIVRAMSELEYVWTLADHEGDIVQAGSTFDIFTTCAQAEAFIQRIGASGQALPRYLPARPLFEALAPRSPSVGVNRGAGESWTGFGDTLPSVLRLYQGK